MTFRTLLAAERRKNTAHGASRRGFKFVREN
jgi:hypothetical protein